jgi:predicted amidohydrolase YtcJ
MLPDGISITSISAAIELAIGRRLSICFLMLVLLNLFGCTPDKEYADTILFNGKIITVDEEMSTAAAIAFRNGEILKVGLDEDVLELRNNDTQVIDLKGHAVIPGLIEGHAHPIAASQSEYFSPIPDLHTIADVLRWIASEARRKSANDWIIHPKFFITRLKDMRQLTKRELDSVAPLNPVFLNGSYGGMVNTKAFEISGMADLQHSGIIRNEQTNEPLGLIRRSAFRLLSLPPVSELSSEQQTSALKDLFATYNRIGITSVCSGGGTAEELNIFRHLLNKGQLTVRIFHNIRAPFDARLSYSEMKDALAALGYKTGDGNEWIKVGALKVVLDGGMLTGTAFLHEGWGVKARDLYGITDPAYRGELFLTKKELVKIITAADEAGWKFTAHVTGGAGVDTLLAAYEQVNQSRPISEKRFSVIHGNFFTADAIRKMAALGVYADMQPAWFFKDTDLLYEVLGASRISTFHPYRSIIEAGVRINGGSDHMVKLDPDLAINPYNPFTAMWSVITRKTDNGTVFNPEQAVTREEALKMYTINNAYASFEEKRKGTIEEGKLADLVILSHDILSCPQDSIREIKPLMTIVNGKTVFNSGKLKAESNR